MTSNLEEGEGSALLEEEVYREYSDHCKLNSLKKLSTGHFDVALRALFPRVSSRSFSNNSYYCGIKKKEMLAVPVAYHVKNPSKQISSDLFKCKPCNATFFSQEDFDRHYDSFHKSKPSYKCGKCYANFSSKEMFEEHFRKVHEEQIPNQNENLNTSYQELAIKTQKRAYGRNWIICNYCNAKCGYQADVLAKHILEVHEGEKIYHCSLCNFTIPDKNEMFLHLSAHEEVESWGSTEFPQNQLETYFPETYVTENSIPSLNENFVDSKGENGARNQKSSSSYEIEFDSSKVSVPVYGFGGAESVEIFQLNGTET